MSVDESDKPATLGDSCLECGAKMTYHSGELLVTTRKKRGTSERQSLKDAISVTLTTWWCDSCGECYMTEEGGLRLAAAHKKLKEMTNLADSMQGLDEKSQKLDGSEDSDCARKTSPGDKHGK